MNQLTTWLETLAPRERRLIQMAAALLGLALLWWLALAPAVQTWRASGSAHAALDAQLLHMQALASEAKSLQAAPRMTVPQAQAWLEAASKKLGASNPTVQGSMWQITLTGVSPEHLAVFLADARQAAQLRPTEVHLKKSAKGWDGVLVLAQP